MIGALVVAAPARTEYSTPRQSRAEIERQRQEQRQSRAGRRRFSERETRALVAFKAGKSVPEIAAILCCTEEDADAWLNDPQPFTFR